MAFEVDAKAFSRSVGSGSFLGLYRGFAISVAGIFVYRAFYFGGYDAGKTFSSMESRKTISSSRKEIDVWR